MTQGTAEEGVQAQEAEGSRRGSLGEVALAFLKLGVISFGGPVAHLGYFRSELVQRRGWISDADYADLVALCQFLPGPASSQVVFGLGMRRAGFLGAMAASLCFTLPSAVLMIAFAYGVAALGDVAGSGWLHGLKLAAVAVVAQAVWGMGKNLCTDRARITLCLLAAGAVLLLPTAMAQVGVIAAGALIGWLLHRRDAAGRAISVATGLRRGRVAGMVALAVFLALLVALPVASRAVTGGGVDRLVAEFDSFYRAGSLVFGGGHVVLPLLRAEVVPNGWLSDELFLAGYGAAQAVPGPLFTFSAYLGAAMHPGEGAWARGLWALLAIFLPAWLLIGGALPFWEVLRSKAWAQASLRGANAAVVGVLLAALWDPVMRSGVRDARDVALALAAFAALQVWRVPVWLVVVAMAGVGWLVSGL